MDKDIIIRNKLNLKSGRVLLRDEWSILLEKGNDDYDIVGPID